MRSKKALYNIITNLILQFFVIIYGFIVPKMIISNYGSNVNGLISSITHFLAYISLLFSIKNAIGVPKEILFSIPEIKTTLSSSTLGVENAEADFLFSNSLSIRA